MAEKKVPGYAGKILRVDLTNEKITEEKLDPAALRKWVGGSGIGVKVLYEEVPPSVQWSDPENRLIVAGGPLGGTAVMGSGTISVVTKGPMTDGAVTTQANGFLGAYMKLAGVDAIVLQGAARQWVYLYLHDGVAELREATHLLGKDTWETQDAITAELGKSERSLSVFSVGPAGEHLVRFAAIAGDKGHVAGHNGSGAVMGSKKLKAIVAERGRGRVAVKDQAAVRQAADGIIEGILANPVSANTYKWGTSMGYTNAMKGGWLPTKNLTTSIFPESDRFLGQNYRSTYKTKPAPCFACRTTHLHMLTVTEGPYKGYVGEEPEYEQWAATGSLIGNTDVGGAVMLSNEIDRLGLEVNETGWVMAWMMECYAKGLITKAELGGLELTWGNTDAALALLKMVANREGIGDILAEGNRRAAARIGGEAGKLAVYTRRGSTPRGHDHRARWFEMLDTCTSDTGTIEAGVPTLSKEIGVPEMSGNLDFQRIGEVMGKTNGRMLFEDCLGTCRFCTRVELGLVVNAINAVTGWDMTVEEAMAVGRRIALVLRCFNARHGARFDEEYPSERYGSQPVDGPVKDHWIMTHWEEMRKQYYDTIGFDLATGKPKPETLRAYGLEDLVADVWTEPVRS